MSARVRTAPWPDRAPGPEEIDLGLGELSPSAWRPGPEADEALARRRVTSPWGLGERALGAASARAPPGASCAGRSRRPEYVAKRASESPPEPLLGCLAKSRSVTSRRRCRARTGPRRRGHAESSMAGAKDVLDSPACRRAQLLGDAAERRELPTLAGSTSAGRGPSPPARVPDRRAHFRSSRSPRRRRPRRRARPGGIMHEAVPGPRSCCRAVWAVQGLEDDPVGVGHTDRDSRPLAEISDSSTLPLPASASILFLPSWPARFRWVKSWLKMMTWRWHCGQ